MRLHRRHRFDVKQRESIASSFPAHDLDQCLELPPQSVRAWSSRIDGLVFPRQMLRQWLGLEFAQIAAGRITFCSRLRHARKRILLDCGLLSVAAA